MGASRLGQRGRIGHARATFGAHECARRGRCTDPGIRALPDARVPAEKPVLLQAGAHVRAGTAIWVVGHSVCDVSCDRRSRLHRGGRSRWPRYTGDTASDSCAATRGRHQGLSLIAPRASVPPHWAAPKRGRVPARVSVAATRRVIQSVLLAVPPAQGPAIVGYLISVAAPLPISGLAASQLGQLAAAMADASKVHVMAPADARRWRTNWERTAGAQGLPWLDGLLRRLPAAAVADGAAPSARSRKRRRPTARPPIV